MTSSISNYNQAVLQAKSALKFEDNIDSSENSRSIEKVNIVDQLSGILTN